MWARAFACTLVRLDNVVACSTQLREYARARCFAKPDARAPGSAKKTWRARSRVTPLRPRRHFEHKHDDIVKMHANERKTHVRADRRIPGSSDQRHRAEDFWCNPNVPHIVVVIVIGTVELHQKSPSTVCVAFCVARLSYTEHPRAHVLGDFCCNANVPHRKLSYTKNPRARFASLSVWHG